MWYMYTVEYYSAIKKNEFESVLLRWMNLEPIIQSEVSQKQKNKYHTLTPILRPSDAKSRLIGKDSDAGRDWGQGEKGMTEDEMAGWHH